MKKVIPYKQMTTTALAVLFDLLHQMATDAALTTGSKVSFPIDRRPEYKSYEALLDEKIMQDYTEHKLKTFSLLKEVGVIKEPAKLVNRAGRPFVIVDIVRKRLLNVAGAVFNELQKRGFDALIDPNSPAAIEYRMQSEPYKLTKNGNALCLNGYVLSRQKAFTAVDLVLEHLLNNPYTVITKRELKDKDIARVSRSFSSIVYDLGFKGILAKAFFKVSEQEILLRNPIHEGTLQELGIPSKDFEQAVEALDISSLFPQPTVPRP